MSAGQIESLCSLPAFIALVIIVLYVKNKAGGFVWMKYYFALLPGAEALWAKKDDDTMLEEKAAAQEAPWY